MKEFMLLIHNLPDSKSAFSAERHGKFLKACETYIQQLQSRNQLISAQPMAREGVMLSSNGTSWKESGLDPKDMIVGYYHVRANDIAEAIAVAKGNPEFAYTETASVEVRPIKTKEATTGYNYPGKQ